MTPAQRNLLKGTQAGQRARGIACTFDQVANPITALVQIVDEKVRKQLEISDYEVSHVLHVLRTDLTAQSVTAKTVKVVTRPDSSQTYRVQYIKDDPQRLNVFFFCVSA